METAIAAFFLIAMAAIAVDLTILTMGFNMLDTTARDAARAAGSAKAPSPTLMAAYALKAAQNQISVHQTDGVFVKQPTLSGVTAPYFVYQDWSSGGTVLPPPPGPNVGVPASPQSPYVTVTVQEDIHLPVNIPFFGQDLATHTAGGYFTIARRYTFPIVKQVF